MSRRNEDAADGPKSLCPRCGYDLRGHPDETQCPECGAHVRVSTARAEVLHWADVRLLDLWSIGLLQSVGAVTGVVSVAAIHRGQYVALILGLASGLYLVVATVWFLVLLIAAIRVLHRPAMAMVHAKKRAAIRRWLWVDAALVVASYTLLTLLVWQR